MALQTYCPHLDHRQRQHQVLLLREPETWELGTCGFFSNRRMVELRHKTVARVSKTTCFYWGNQFFSRGRIGCKKGSDGRIVEFIGNQDEL